MKKLILSATAILTLMACNGVDPEEIDNKSRLYGEWTTLDESRDIRTNVIFREDLTYESTIKSDPEIRENGTWDMNGSTLMRDPSKCYAGASVTTCSNRNDGEISFTEDGFDISVHKVDFELNIDTTYVISYEKVN